MITRSIRGFLFSTPSVVVSLPPYNAANPAALSFFDQGTSIDSFRTNAYPTIAIDRRPDAGSEDVDEPDTAAFRGRIFVAWSQRGVGPGGDARVVLSVSTDGASTWSAPKPIDNASLADDSGTSFSRGHQFMPQMTVTADKITVIYYDARLDHTFGLFSPRSNPLLPDPVTGKLYLETRALKGELLDPGGATRVFTPFFVETGMTEWRHTLDLRVAQADSAVSPAFTSARLSQYIFGTRGDETGTVTALQQLQVNPPNLRLFQQGTVPFLGDYIDVAGPTFLPPRAPGLRWRFNTRPGTFPVFLASWTSNQDVRPPLDGDWTHYTPAASTGGSSVFNPSVPRPPCQQGQEGMRNQNIYAARISQGLAVTSVQNAKPLSPTLQRDLTVSLENLTPLSRTFRLTVASQPVGGRASFVPAPNPVPNPLPAATATLDVVIPANSSVARSVYALSTNPNALVEVDVAEVNGPPGSPLKADGLTGFVIFNTDPSAPTLVNPDNTTAPSVTTVEVYNPNVTNPNVTNPNVTNPNVTNPNVTNPNVTNPNVTNPNVTNPNVTNADLANPNVTNPNVTNPNVTNPNVTNPNVTNPNVTNAPVSDATYTVTNTGNTAATYHVQLAGTAPAGTPLQLIISKPYANPASLNCVLFEQQRNIPVSSVVNPTFVDPNLPPNPAITDPSDGNATFVLAPGESILVTIRGPVDVPTLTNIIQNVAPVVVAHAPNTNDPTNKPATSPPSITTSALPDGVATRPYSATLTALGGTRPYILWAATGLPAGLSISGTDHRPDLGDASGRRHVLRRRVADGLRPENRQPRLHAPHRESSRDHDDVAPVRHRGVPLQSAADVGGRYGSRELDDLLRVAASGPDAVGRADHRHSGRSGHLQLQLAGVGFDEPRADHPEPAPHDHRGWPRRHRCERELRGSLRPAGLVLHLLLHFRLDGYVTGLRDRDSESRRRVAGRRRRKSVHGARLRLLEHGRADPDDRAGGHVQRPVRFLSPARRSRQSRSGQMEWGRDREPDGRRNRPPGHTVDALLVLCHRHEYVHDALLRGSLRLELSWNIHRQRAGHPEPLTERLPPGDDRDDRLFRASPAAGGRPRRADPRRRRGGER